MNENQLNERIKYFEDTILDFFIRIGKKGGQNESAQQILGLLFIYRKMTQKQLIDKTGLSAGTISNVLTTYTTTLPLFQKSYIPGTHTLIYTREKDYLETAKTTVPVLLSSILENKNIIQDLSNEIKNEKNRDLEGYQLFIDFLSDFNEALSLFEKLARKHQEDLNSLFLKSEEFIAEINSEHTKFNVDSIKNLIKKPSSPPPILNDQLVKLERKVIDIFTKSSLFLGRNTMNSRVFCSFFIRRVLTQEILQDLTGLSAGKVSNTLNELVEMGYIENFKIKKKRKKFYRIPSLKFTIALGFYDSLLIAIDKLGDFKIVYDEINKFPENIKKNEDILAILNFVKQLLQMGYIYKSFIDLAFNELKSIIM